MVARGDAIIHLHHAGRWGRLAAVCRLGAGQRRCALADLGEVDHVALVAIERDVNKVHEYDIDAALRLVTLKLVGYTEVIHALMHENNLSATHSGNHASRIFRRYALWGSML